MKLGTRSVLYGYHCLLVHWWFVARGWHELYGWKKIPIGRNDRRLIISTSLKDPRLWVAFFVHDLGYWGRPNMDGEEGERHPEWAKRKMDQWFGAPWGDFCLYHSRFYAKLNNAQPSPLCFADKLAILYTPDWWYLRCIFWTGEVHEYMRNSQRMIDATVAHADAVVWLRDVKAYVRSWVDEFKDGRPDTRTKVGDNRTRFADRSSGVWK